MFTPTIPLPILPSAAQYMTATDQDKKNWFEAAKKGDLTTIKTLLIKGIDVNIINNVNPRTEWTALMLTSSLVIVKELLKTEGIDVNFQGPHGWTPLMSASAGGKTDIVKELLKVPGINFNIKKADGTTALMLAVIRRHPEVITELLKIPGIDINIQKDSGSTALILAVKNNQLDIMKKLLKFPGINVNLQKINGDTALIIASRHGDLTLVKELMKNPKIDVNLEDQQGFTALDISSEGNHEVYISIVRELLKNPMIDVNNMNSGKTPLMRASNWGYLEIVEELLKNPKINVNISDDIGDTALILAISRLEKTYDKDIRNRLSKIINLLQGYEQLVPQVVHPINGIITKQDKENWFKMAEYGGTKRHLNIMRALLNKGININLIKDFGDEDENGETALISASSVGNIEIVKGLLKYPQIDINIKGPNGWTALTAASVNEREEIVEELLKHPKININITDDTGSTALQIVEEDMEEMLLLLAGDPDELEDWEETTDQIVGDRLDRLEEIADLLRNYKPPIQQVHTVILQQVLTPPPIVQRVLSPPPMFSPIPIVQPIFSPPPIVQRVFSPPPMFSPPQRFVQQELQVDPNRLGVGRTNKTNRFYTVKELKQIAGRLGLSTSGTKAQLIQRIIVNF